MFTTVNMQQYHPLVAALMTSTIDHVSGGRFSLNVVAGFNEQEFNMLGIEVPSHEDRYAHAAEWMTIIRRAWTDHGAVRLRRRLPRARGGRLRAQAAASSRRRRS